MARVAANQDRSEASRKDFVYKQHIHIATHKPDSRMSAKKTPITTWRFGRTEPTGSSNCYRALLEQRQVCGLSRRACAVPGSTNADLIHNLRNHEPVPEPAERMRI